MGLAGWRRRGVVGGDAAGRDADGLGGLGGVLGQVGRDRDVGDLAVVGEADDAGVDLGAPGDVPALRPGRVGDGGEPRRAGHGLDDTGEHVGGDRGRWRDGAFGMDRVDAVEAEDGVEVDQSAALELGHFGEGDPDPGAGLASLSSRRRMAMTVRRHSSPQWAFQTTEAL